VLNTLHNLYRHALDRGRLRIAAVVQGRQRCPGEEVAEDGDFVTLRTGCACRSRSTNSQGRNGA